MREYNIITHHKYKEIHPMMGYQDPPQENLFQYHVYLEERVRKDHPLRKIKERIDFDFIYGEVKDAYGTTGNISIPPPVILKLMLLLFFYNVRSERELMETIPERLDWLWFLGYGLDTPIPTTASSRKPGSDGENTPSRGSLNGSLSSAWREDWSTGQKSSWIVALSMPMPPITQSWIPMR